MNPVMEFQKAVKQQTEDLREELNDLAKWEEEITQKENAAKKKKVSDAPSLPPIRGTVPSLKQDKAKPKEDPVQTAKDQGNEYFKVGKIDDAIRLYTKGIDLDPDSASTHVLYGNRAMCHLKTGEFEKAERDATKCVQMNRAYAKGFYRRAMARRQLKKYREARSDLETVLALVPGDADAETELRVVTALIREADAKDAGASSAPQRKKIVISEVDDDEDDDAAAVATAAAPPAEEAEDPALVAERQQRIDRDMEKLEVQRRADEDARKREAKKQEDELQRNRRSHARVEVVEEDEPEPAPAKMDDARVHVDPTVKPRGPSSSSGSQPRSEAAVPQPRNVKTVWTTSNIKPPKNFTEFERVYRDVRQQSELLDFLISSVDASLYKTIFGVNLTPELLTDILKSACRGSGARANSIFSGLCTLSQVKELAIFFSDEENALLENALRLVESSGSTAQVVQKFRKAFQL